MVIKGLSILPIKLTIRCSFVSYVGYPSWGGRILLLYSWFNQRVNILVSVFVPETIKYNFTLCDNYIVFVAYPNTEVLCSKLTQISNVDIKLISVK